MFGSGPWFMFLLPVLVIVVVAVLLVLAGSILLRELEPEREARGASARAKTCPRCGRPMQPDWQVCPYDNTCIC
jgi:hypothetical protein